MPDIKDITDEFDRLDSKDKHWIMIAVVAAGAALVSAALSGSLFGDLIAFVLTFSAGFFAHNQWSAVRGSRGSTTRRKASRSRGTRTRRKARAA